MIAFRMPEFKIYFIADARPAKEAGPGRGPAAHLGNRYLSWSRSSPKIAWKTFVLIRGESS
jgi:hypothetical protein